MAGSGLDFRIRKSAATIMLPRGITATAAMRQHHAAIIFVARKCGTRKVDGSRVGWVRWQARVGNFRAGQRHVLLLVLVSVMSCV